MNNLNKLIDAIEMRTLDNEGPHPMDVECLIQALRKAVEQRDGLLERYCVALGLNKLNTSITIEDENAELAAILSGTNTKEE